MPNRLAAPRWLVSAKYVMSDDPRFEIIPESSRLARNRKRRQAVPLRSGLPRFSQALTLAARAMNNPIRSSSLCHGFRRGGRLLATSGKCLAMTSAMCHLVGRCFSDSALICEFATSSTITPCMSQAFFTAPANTRPRWRLCRAPSRSNATNNGFARRMTLSSILTALEVDGGMR